MAGWFAAAGLEVDHVEHLEGRRADRDPVARRQGGRAGSGGRHERLRAARATICRCSPKRAATSRSASNSSRPRPRSMAETLWESIQTLAPLQPRFVSVTYGAGGSTRERTHATVERILKETALTPAAHLTCVGATRDEVDAVARDYWELGVRHIVALRGDPPEPGTKYRAASRRLSRCRRAGRRPESGRAVRHFGRRLSRNAIRIPSTRAVRSRQSEAQGRRRRRPRDHPVLLLARLLLPLPRRSRGGRDRRRDRARHPAGLQRRHDAPLRRRPAARRIPTGSTSCSRGSTICPRRAS